MKRAKGLFDLIHDRENLRHAAHAAMRRKRAKMESRQFASNLEQELKKLSDDIRGGLLVLGEHHQFWIRDPKERLITAPCCVPRRFLRDMVSISSWIFGNIFLAYRTTDLMLC
jgi:RNA-directed DNA polymerase